CDDTQAVILFSWGINTDSTIRPSYSLTAFLMVPSALRCIWSTWMWLMVKCSFSRSRVGSDRLVIWSKSLADSFQSHSYTCCARNGLSPSVTKIDLSSTFDRFRLSRFDSVPIMMHNYVR